MTLDHALALTFVPSLPRTSLADRLRAEDPALLDLATPFLERARTARIEAERAGIRWAVWGRTGYPTRLHPLSDAPAALWFRGTLDCLEGPAVAIVGARAASAVALETARRLAEEVAARGVTVVSGLARGVDSAAHRGALAAGGRTAAVLGGGVDVIYPPEHDELAGQIAQTGVVLSEFPPGTPSLPFHFPLRNRIISGLVSAVVVVEAAEKSGSLITAACALEQGREVMAVPGSVLGGRNRGGHALLRDGAKIVETGDDIVGELLGSDVGWSVAQLETLEDSMTSSGRLLACMDAGVPVAADELAGRTGLDGAGVLRALTDLELAGRVRRVGAGCYSRVS